MPDVAKIAICRLRGDTCLICDRFHRQSVEPSLPLDDGFASGQQPLHGLHRSGLARHHAKGGGNQLANGTGREIAQTPTGGQRPDVDLFEPVQRRAQTRMV